MRSTDPTSSSSATPGPSNRAHALLLPFIWVLWIGYGFTLLVGIGWIWFNSDIQKNEAINSFQATQGQNTLLIFQNLHSFTDAQDWANAQKVLMRFHSVLPQNTLRLVAPNGQVFANSRGNQPDPRINTALFQSDSPTIGHHWPVAEMTLWSYLPLLSADGQTTAYLLNESSFQETVHKIQAERNSHLGQFIIYQTLIFGMFWLLYRTGILYPAQRLQRTIQAALRGSQKTRLVSARVQEWQEVFAATNSLIERVASQRETIDILNKKNMSARQNTQPITQINDQTTRRRSQRLEGLNAIIATTSTVLEMPALIRSTLDQLLHILDVARGVIWVNDLIIQRGFNEDSEAQVTTLLQESLPEPSRKLILNDRYTAPNSLNALTALLQALQVRSTILLPIFCNGQLAGHIFLARAEASIWSTEESTLLEMLANQIGFTAERASYIQDIQHHNQMMNTLVDQSELLNRPFTPQGVVDAIGSGAQALSQADSVIILERDPQNRMICLWSYEVSEKMIQATLEKDEHLSKYSHMFTTLPILIENINQIGGTDAALQQDLSHANVRAFFIWPLTYEGQARVYVCCFFQHVTRLKSNEQEVMQAFFRQAAAAMENARLFTAECHQRQLAEALRDVTATLAETLNLEEVLEGVLQQLRRVLPHDAANIMLMEQNQVKIVRHQGYSANALSTLAQWTAPVNTLGNLQRMVETGQSLVIADTRADPLWVQFPFSEWILSYAGAPMIHRGMVYGFINISSSRVNFFDLETSQILQTFASQAAISIENARLYQHTQQRVMQTDALFRAMLPLFNPSEDIRALSKQITESVNREFDSAHCSVLLMDESRTHLVLTAQTGYVQTDTGAFSLDGPGLTVAAAQSGQIIYSPDVKQDARYILGSHETRSELAIPLQGRDQILGVLNLESTLPNAFDENAQRILSSYAERAALGLENAHLFQTIRRHAEQMIQMSEITRTALQTINQQEMLTQLVYLVAKLMQSDQCYINSWDQLHQQVHLIAEYNLKPSQLTVVEPGELTLTESALRMRRTLLINDLSDSPYISPRLAAQIPTASVAAFPLIVDDINLGAIMVGFYETHSFSSQEVTLGEQAAGQVALAIMRMRSLELAQRRAAEAETLRQVGIALTSSLELQAVLDSILNHLEAVLPFASACVFLAKEDCLSVGALKNIQNGEEVKHQTFSRSDALFTEIAITRRPVILLDAQADPRFKRWGNTDHVHGWMGVPLIAGDDLLGILTVDRIEPNSFSQEELELAQGFANHAAIAVQNATLHSAVQSLAITDPLTGAYNRRGFFELAQKIMASAQRSHRPVSALMIDLDFFKRVNDRYGHDVGDIVLRILVERSLHILREMDLICRYGGEEFVILLPESDLSGASAVAQRIFSAICHEPIPTPAGPISVTVSIGIATQCPECTALDGLLKCADEALYSAKREGRNRISAWSQ